MNKVLIVDDEPLVRLAVKSLVNWEEQGFVIAGEAANGRQALKVLHDHPDIAIVVTDINMPIMDGLDLIGAIKKAGLNPGIVVLSAYQDYALVRQAFKLGAQDYILKTEMNPENMIRLLSGITWDHTGTNHPASFREPSIRELKVLKERFIRDCLEGVTGDIPEQIRKYGIRMGRQNLAVCFFWVDDYQVITGRYGSQSLKTFITAVGNAIEQVLAANNTGEIISLSPEEYVLILSLEGNSGLAAREKLGEILNQIKHALTNYLNVSVSIGVSRFENGYQGMGRQFREAENHARLRFVLGKGRIIFTEDVEWIKETATERVIGHEDGLVAALRKADREQTIQALHHLLNLIGGHKRNQIEMIYPFYMEIVFVLAKFLHEIGEDLGEVANRGEADFYLKITGFETQAEIHAWLEQMTERILDRLQEKKDIKVNRSIARAQEFIRVHYNQDLTLKMVSDFVGLSESHFSNLFARKMGTSFIDYLTRVRVEKAKELMNTTHLKIYEIALQVGYASTEHFSRMFKKITGMSPNQYKA